MSRTRKTPPDKAPAKPPTPKGTDRAFSITAGGQKISLCYWDLWFSIVAQRHFDGSFEALRQELRRLKEASSLDRESYWAKLSHLGDLRRRVEPAGLDAVAIVEAASPLSTGEVRRARGKVLEKSDKRSEWSEPMVFTPDQRRRAFSLRGLWCSFPVSPHPFADEIMGQFKTSGFYSEGQSFSVARRLDRYTAKAGQRLEQGKTAEGLALLRAVMTATVELMGFADDSFGAIGDSFQTAFRRYLRLSPAEAGIDDALFLPDLLTFLVWEDYGLTHDQTFGYFRRLTKGQASLCLDHLRRQVGELRDDDLDYQADNALTLLGQIAAEKCRFEMFAALAEEMGTRHWDRILRMADAAVHHQRRDVALLVLETALKHPGRHQPMLAQHYEQLKRGQWQPKLLG